MTGRGHLRASVARHPTGAVALGMEGWRGAQLRTRSEFSWIKGLNKTLLAVSSYGAGEALKPSQQGGQMNTSVAVAEPSTPTLSQSLGRSMEDIEALDLTLIKLKLQD